jgi:transposase
MDVEGIDALLDLPAFRVTTQVIRPHELARHLERRDTDLVGPRCYEGCARSKDGSTRCRRAVPMVDRPGTLRLPSRRLPCSACAHRPWEQSATCGAGVQGPERLDDHVRQALLHGGPCQALARRSGLSARMVVRWPVATSRGGRSRKRGRALGIDEDARRKGPHDTTSRVDLERGRPITPCKGRRGEAVGQCFKSRPQAELEGVEGVGLEMSQSL